MPLFFQFCGDPEDESLHTEAADELRENCFQVRSAMPKYGVLVEGRKGAGCVCIGWMSGERERGDGERGRWTRGGRGAIIERDGWTRQAGQIGREGRGRGKLNF